MAGKLNASRFTGTAKDTAKGKQSTKAGKDAVKALNAMLNNSGTKKKSK